MWKYRVKIISFIFHLYIFTLNSKSCWKQSGYNELIKTKTL